MSKLPEGIDFDESSRAWRMNKTRSKQSIGNKRWKYCCIIEGCNTPPNNACRSVYSKHENPLIKYEPGLCTKHKKIKKYHDHEQFLNSK